jgi:hypothetical protein
MQVPSSPPWWVELLKAIPSVVTAGTAIYALVIARAGLNKWRTETLGKRKAEIAEQLLTTAYKTRDLLIWARTPVLMSGEGESRKSTESEDDVLRERRNTYFVPIERLARETETFATLQTLKYAVAARFGPDAVKPIAAIVECHRAITFAASMLIHLARCADDPVAKKNSIDQLSASLGTGPRPDKMDQEIDEAISSIETFCKPVLSEGTNT